MQCGKSQNCTSGSWNLLIRTNCVAGPAHGSGCQESQLRESIPARLSDSQEANGAINGMRRVYEEEKQRVLIWVKQIWACLYPTATNCPACEGVFPHLIIYGYFNYIYLKICHYKYKFLHFSSTYTLFNYLWFIQHLFTVCLSWCDSSLLCSRLTTNARTELMPLECRREFTRQVGSIY